jgi:glucose-1-phosphate thymidylyltransferase
MKGVVLAGGSGSRLLPSTKVTNKHLLQVYNRPMIYFPLRTLKSAGIEETLIVTGGDHIGDISGLLGDGNDFGMEFTYKVQSEAGGIAQALGLAEKFSNGQNIAVILGDNIYSDKLNILDFKEGARIYLKEVENPSSFGVAILGKDKKVEMIEEKPLIPKSNYAVTGLYIYDNSVFKIIKGLKPSNRKELEITDVNNAYIGVGNLEAQIIKGHWSDAGTHDSLYKAATIVKDNLTLFR